MRLVKTEELKEGQKAAKDVADFRGNLLFKVGTEITAATIERLKSRMVPHVYVEDDGSSAAGMSEEDIKRRGEEIDAELTAVFADVTDNPLMMSLCESSRQYLKKHVRPVGG
ncbi:MAG: hypothetical protein A2Z34_00460 [Planctomycetes bacterium RBG_16_59_8]|nr:MAG: hypothetical protein A2Z34_00460 [Planctomycetes bacterium RBG_16_59_8]